MPFLQVTCNSITHELVQKDPAGYVTIQPIITVPLEIMLSFVTSFLTDLTYLHSPANN